MYYNVRLVKKTYPVEKLSGVALIKVIPVTWSLEPNLYLCINICVGCTHVYIYWIISC